MPQSFEVDLGDEDQPVNPLDLSVEFYDPEIVGLILGPDGAPLSAVTERRPFPFGFSKGP